MDPASKHTDTESAKKNKHQDRNKSILHTLDSGKRSITIQDVGEITKYPDILKFTVSVSSSKESIESVKTSVKRRTDYILQTLRSYGIGEKSLTISTDINRGEGYEMRSDVVVQHGDANQCQNARNFLVEKLDSSVVISPITCYCSSTVKEQLRHQAFSTAIRNAHSKAQSVSKTLGLSLRSPLSITEHSCELKMCRGDSQDAITQDGSSVALNVDPLECQSLHQKLTKASLTYVSSVTVVFEAVPLRTCQHKKCPKHHT